MATETLRLSVRHLPTVVVFGMLAGLAYWGHHSGWKIPKFSTIFSSKAAEQEDWCSLHNVPLSRCIACNPELAGEDPADWCKEHGLPESKCTICHPDLQTGGSAEWCPEHAIPEKSCTLCHPEIAVKSPRPPSETGAEVVQAISSKLPKDPKTCQTHTLRIQFASPDAVRKAGVKLSAVESRRMTAFVPANGELEYDQTRVARISSIVQGTAWRIPAEVGKKVKCGELLGVVDAAEVGRFKAEFLLAAATTEAKSRLLNRLRAAGNELKNLVDLKARYAERVKKAAQENLLPQATLQEAEASLSDAQLQALKTNVEMDEAEAQWQEAHIRLFNAQQSLVNLGLKLRIEDVAGLSNDKLIEEIRFLGFPDAMRKDLAQSAMSANLLPILAPFDGVVVARDVVVGEVLDTNKTLFVVADINRMWLRLDVRQEDVSAVKDGQKVIFHPDVGTENAVIGKVSWVSTDANERTRTVSVRAILENPEGRLRAGMFGGGRIITRETPTATAVPSEAIHWEGCCHVVFVRLTDDIFQTRKVKLGAKNGPFTEIRNGVMPGEVVATAGSHVLKSEILKSALGAGCCEALPE